MRRSGRQETIQKQSSYLAAGSSASSYLLCLLWGRGGGGGGGSAVELKLPSLENLVIPQANLAISRESRYCSSESVRKYGEVVVVLLAGCFFFSEFGLSRNYHIKSVVLFGGGSVVPLLGCLESYRAFVS